MMTLYDKTRQVIAEHSLIPPGCKVLIGVSGGVDSLVLQHLLLRLQAAFDFNLHVATLDHGLRGAAGAADADYVVECCTAWGVPVTRRTLALDGASEERARQARYAFLAEVARVQGAGFVAVAHHADDQAETVLMRLIRGTGLRGLSGMSLRAPLPGDPGLTLLRPLLFARRAEIEAYCREQGLQPRQDATNDDPGLLRNRLRLETLPALRQLNPQIDRALVQLADQAAQDAAYIEEQLAAALGGQVQVSDHAVGLPREVFSGLHPALRSHFVLWALEQIGGSDYSSLHVNAAVDLALRGRVGQRALFPGGRRLRLEYRQIVIEGPAESAPDDSLPLLTPGTVLFVPVPAKLALPTSGWVLETGCQPLGEAQVRLAIPAGAALHLRTRQPGDRFAPQGLGGHEQKLKKWLIDHKVPQALRDYLPLLVVNGEIAAFYTGSRWTLSAHFAGGDAVQAGLYFRFMKTESISSQNIDTG